MRCESPGRCCNDERDVGYEVTAHAAPARDVPLYVASRGEQINTLASREADGVFLSGFDPQHLDPVLGWVRSAGTPTVALYQSVRFRPSETPDPTSITGSPSELAAQPAAPGGHCTPRTRSASRRWTATTWCR